jgi:hypothetical protein
MGAVAGPSRLAPVEYDTPEADERLLDDLLGGELPLTPIVVSGSGRLHLYFADPGGLRKATRDGMELRVGSHQCAVPPSLHLVTGREYRWREGLEPWNVEPLPIPQAILDHFALDPDTPRRADPVEEIIPEGMRHNVLLSLAGTMRRRRLTEEEMLPTLRAVNERRCRPPMPEDELEKLATDVANRFEPGAPMLSRRNGRAAPVGPELDEERVEYLRDLRDWLEVPDG